MDDLLVAAVFFDEPLVMAMFLSGVAIFVVTYIAMMWSSKREQAIKDQSLRNSRPSRSHPCDGDDYD